MRRKTVDVFYEESKRQRLRRKVGYARILRQRMTTAEKILWRALRNRQCADLKFRRQVPMGMYIADFLCREYRLIIEVDGDIHKETHLYDGEKDCDQEIHGYRVMRFHNNQVQHDLKSVLGTIIKSVPSPGRQVGRVGEGKQG